MVAQANAAAQARRAQDPLADPQLGRPFVTGSCLARMAQAWERQVITHQQGALGSSFLEQVAAGGNSLRWIDVVNHRPLGMRKLQGINMHRVTHDQQPLPTQRNEERRMPRSVPGRLPPTVCRSSLALRTNGLPNRSPRATQRPCHQPRSSSPSNLVQRYGQNSYQFPDWLPPRLGHWGICLWFPITPPPRYKPMSCSDDDGHGRTAVVLSLKSP